MVKVRERAVRGVTFLPHGQRFEGWVPAGEYAVEGRCNLGLGHGSTETRPAVMIRHPEHGQWYVGVAVVYPPEPSPGFYATRACEDGGQ